MIIELNIKKAGVTAVTQRLMALIALGCCLQASTAVAEKFDDAWKKSTIEIVTPLGGTSRAAGSGLIVSESGYVISARHVVEAEGNRRAIFADGKSYPLRLVAAPRDLDLAILKIDAKHSFTPFPLASSAAVKIGDSVVATGNPGGKGLVASRGKVRATGKTWRWGGPYSDKMIDFDAPISGGNSGGPLLNDRGEVIGVVFSVAIGEANVSFAYPLDGTLDFLRKTLAEEGLYFFDLGMDIPSVGAAQVKKVMSGSPADRAGLKEGDLITKVDKVEVQQGFDFQLAMIGRRADEKLSIEFLRKGKTMRVSLTLGKGKCQPAVEVADAAQGLRLQYYKGDWERLPDFSKLKPKTEGIAKSISVEAYRGQDHFAIRLTGYLQVPTAGRYIFSLASDDGAQLSVAGRNVVRDDGLHAARLRRGLPLHLEPGLHPIDVTYFEHSHNESLSVLWEGPGFNSRELPASALFHSSER
jgi:S1-C subfamily serine protease